MEQLLNDLTAWKTEKDCLIKYTKDLNKLIQHQHIEIAQLKEKIRIMENGQELMDLFK
jgi:mRNA-degrading endonuclease YafQ of YafQ-DinJ toxin-antitoxin module